MSAMPETKPRQEKGGVEISITPVTYKVVRQDVTTLRQAPSFITSPEWVDVEETTKPKIGVAPQRIAFLVKINNKLPRVFRGAGTVVQFNVGGKPHAVDQAHYVHMQNAIIPPRTEQQIEIYGPPLSEVPDKTTIGLFFYDVVTSIDQAGTVTEKQNYEWFYDYAAKPHTEEGQTVTLRKRMSIVEYQAAMAKEQMRNLPAMYQPGAGPPGAAPNPGGR